MTQMTLTTPLATLAVLSAYLITGSFVVGRIGPPIFFTFSLLLVLASSSRSIAIATACVALAITANAFLAIDHIHGNCSYDVLYGTRSWHKDRIGDLHWYRQCVQPATAFWVMSALGTLWLGILIREIHTWYTQRSARIELPRDEPQPSSV